MNMLKIDEHAERISKMYIKYRGIVKDKRGSQHEYEYMHRLTHSKRLWKLKGEMIPAKRRYAVNKC